MLAQTAADFAGLDRVYFIPTANPPHKTGRALSPFETRLRMVESAIEDNGLFEVSLVEKKDGPSYTWESVVHFSRMGYDRESLHLVVGEDSLAEIEGWRRPGVILEHATVVAMRRPGSGWDGPPPVGASLMILDTGSNTVSSSAIRRLVGSGRSIRYLVPPGVERIIREEGLFSSGG